jgi:RND family efflux transporter MFP subunit
MAVQPSPVEVRLARVTAGPLFADLRFTGEVRALRRAQVRAETSGRVLEMPWRIGNRLESDEILARLDGSKNAVAIRQSRARLAQTEIAFEQATKKSKRSEQLFGSEKISAEKYDDAVFTHRRAEAELELRRAELASIERLGSDYAIRAPYEAYITSIDVEVGDYVSDGTAAFTLVAATGTKVVFHVPAESVSSFELGRQYEVEIPALDRKYEARLAAIAKEADPRSRTFELELDVERDMDLHPGMIARISFRVPTGGQGHFVPSHAVLEKFGGSFVFIYENGVAREIPVVIEQRDAERVALSGDLDPGAWVIAAGQHGLDDGSPVLAETESLAGRPATTDSLGSRH